MPPNESPLGVVLEIALQKIDENVLERFNAFNEYIFDPSIANENSTYSFEETSDILFPPENLAVVCDAATVGSHLNKLILTDDESKQKNLERLHRTMFRLSLDFNFPNYFYADENILNSYPRQLIWELFKLNSDYKNWHNCFMGVKYLAKMTGSSIDTLDRILRDAGVKKVTKRIDMKFNVSGHNIDNLSQCTEDNENYYVDGFIACEWLLTNPYPYPTTQYKMGVNNQGYNLDSPDPTNRHYPIPMYTDTKNCGYSARLNAIFDKLGYSSQQKLEQISRRSVISLALLNKVLEGERGLFFHQAYRLDRCIHQLIFSNHPAPFVPFRAFHEI